jgi:hypothetical protein
VPADVPALATIAFGVGAVALGYARAVRFEGCAAVEILEPAAEPAALDYGFEEFQGFEEFEEFEEFEQFEEFEEFEEFEQEAPAASAESA